MKLLLCGEGRNELGSRSGDPVYQSGDERGVIEALLRLVRQDGWEIAEGLQWKNIRKFRTGQPEAAERRNVQGAALFARERGYDALVFSRDRDGDQQREADVEAGIAAAAGGPTIAGAVAVEKLEGWVRALRGKHRSEELNHPEVDLAQDLGLPGTDTLTLVAAIPGADLARLPADANSLRRFIERAERVLKPSK